MATLLFLHLLSDLNQELPGGSGSWSRDRVVRGAGAGGKSLRRHWARLPPSERALEVRSARSRRGSPRCPRRAGGWPVHVCVHVKTSSDRSMRGVQRVEEGPLETLLQSSGKKTGKNVRVHFSRTLKISQRAIATWGAFTQEQWFPGGKIRERCGILTCPTPASPPAAMKTSS